MENEKKKYNFLKMLSALIKNLNKHDKSIYIYFIIYSITAAVYPFFGVYLQKVLISELTREEIVINNLLISLGVYLGLAVIIGFISEFFKYIAEPRMSRLRINLLADMCKKMLEMDYKYTEDSKFQDDHQLAFDSCNGNNNGVEFVYKQLFANLSRVLTIIIFGIMVWLLSPLAILAIIISVGLAFFVKRIINKLQYKHKAELSSAERKVNYFNRTANNSEYGKDVRVYNLQKKVLGAHNQATCSYINVFKKIKNREYAYGFIELLGTLVSDCLIYGILLYKIINGQIDLALFTMYLSASLTLSTTLKSLMDSISKIQYEGLYVSELFEYLEANLNESTGNKKALTDATLEIELKNVSFKYPNTDKYIYKNLNLKIPAGQKLAIVGINGAGKTTLVKLLTRLFEVTDGEITVNGTPIKEFDLLEYQKMFGVVFQDVHMLAMSIEENLTYQKDNFDEERIDQVLKQVGLYNKVYSYSQNVKQMMLKILDENGIILSGGESQKLAIARALYKNGRCVILDEPTSALDALAEAEIYEEFDELVKGNTAIYISHRLASTKFCDKIALFSNDGLIEYGTHEELMAKKGEYYKMFITQGKYYQEGENHEE